MAGGGGVTRCRRGAGAPADPHAGQLVPIDFVNPIVGGPVEDLQHLKVLSETPSPVTAEVNPNYKNTSVRQAPASARFGLRFLF
jgi:hypothetical protein